MRRDLDFWLFWELRWDIQGALCYLKWEPCLPFISSKARPPTWNCCPLWSHDFQRHSDASCPQRLSNRLAQFQRCTTPRRGCGEWWLKRRCVTSLLRSEGRRRRVAVNRCSGPGMPLVQCMIFFLLAFGRGEIMDEKAICTSGPCENLCIFRPFWADSAGNLEFGASCVRE